MYTMFAPDQHGSKTYDLIYGLAEPQFRKIIEAGVFVNRRHQRPRIDIRVSNAAYKDAGRRSPVNV
jgi:hypothetical protein